MNIVQIKYFVSAFEQGSFSAAARSRYVTVQAVSKAIGDLEREIGDSLFIRKNRSVEPTDLGKDFYVQALIALREFERLETFGGASDETPADTRALTILLCAPPFNHNDRVIANIESIIERCVHLPATVRLSAVQDGIDALIARKVDALITVGALSHPLIESASVGTMPTGVVMAADHPLAAESAVSIGDLHAWPVMESEVFDRADGSILNIYRKCGLASKSVKVAQGQDFDFAQFLAEDRGYVFCVAVPAMVHSVPAMAMRHIAPDDAQAVPICFNILRDAPSASQHALLRIIANPAVLFDLESESAQSSAQPFRGR